jgi:hypothetical protein
MPKNNKKRGPHPEPLSAAEATELLQLRGLSSSAGDDDTAPLAFPDIPAPDRDERDGKRRLEGCLLVAMSGIAWGENKQTAEGWLYADDARRRWKEQHGEEFSQTYAALVDAGINANRHSSEVLPEVQAWLTKRKS